MIVFCICWTFWMKKIADVWSGYLSFSMKCTKNLSEDESWTRLELLSDVPKIAMSIPQGRIDLEAGYLGRFFIIVFVCIENLLAGNDINLHDFICIFSYPPRPLRPTSLTSSSSSYPCKILFWKKVKNKSIDRWKMWTVCGWEVLEKFQT